MKFLAATNNNTPAKGKLVPITDKLPSDIASYIYDRLITIILPVVSAIAVGAVLYAGVLYMTSQGDPEKLTKAKKALLYSIIGILLVAFSWAIVITLSGGYLNQFFS